MEVQIGESAGKVWQALNSGGAKTKSQLQRDTGLSAEMLNMAVGWLARESKLDFTDKGKAGIVLSLQ